MFLCAARLLADLDIRWVLVVGALVVYEFSLPNQAYKPDDRQDQPGQYSDNEEPFYDSVIIFCWGTYNNLKLFFYHRKIIGYNLVVNIFIETVSYI